MKINDNSRMGTRGKFCGRRPCFNLIKNSLAFWRALAHYPSNWKTFNVRLKRGINDVLEVILAFCLKDIF